MKKHDLFLTLSTLAYSYLFYKQSPGINFMIFSLLMLALLLASKPRNLQTYRWAVPAFGLLFSGFFVMWFGNSLSVFANVASLFFLTAMVIRPKTSFIVGGINAVYSALVSCSQIITDYQQRLEKERLFANKKTGTQQASFYVFAIPIVAFLLFFLMYRSANPLFHNLTQNINLDFISFTWLLFTFSGFYLLYGIFYFRFFRPVIISDDRADDQIRQGSLPDYRASWVSRYFNIETEYKSAFLLFLLLNLLLLSVNLTDFTYLFAGVKLPEGMDYSGLVHQGVGMVITSIVVAISIILFYFRGHLNFYEKSGTLKILACIWIAQNMLLLGATAYKNLLYVNEYSLTYKRIGVFVYLLLTLIGLVTTFIKVNYQKSNWYLFRKNGFIFYLVLVYSTAINWDVLITEYNLKYSKEIDKHYLLRLSYINLPYFLEKDPAVLHRKPHNYLEEILQEKARDFYETYGERGWQSWAFHKSNVYKYLGEKMKTHPPLYSNEAYRPFKGHPLHVKI